METQGDVLISVCIPVKNGAGWIEACMEGIMKQTLFHKTEVIIIDSGSTDDTLEILKNYPARVYSIPAHEFNHGATRNLAVKYCQGKYVVMTVQDARASSDTWLEELLNGFSNHENVAGVCGMQIVPHEIDKNPVEWFRPQSEGKISVYHFSTPEAFDMLSPDEKKNAASWDDVTAMYLKEVLEKIPFEPIVYGEDAVWAKAALRKGYALVYNPAARVYHYHQENEEYSFKRTLTAAYLRYKLFNRKPILPKLGLLDTLRLVKVIWKSGPMNSSQKLNWLKYNIVQHKAMVKAYHVFMNALAISEDELTRVHDKHCSKPPIPVKI